MRTLLISFLFTCLMNINIFAQPTDDDTTSSKHQGKGYYHAKQDTNIKGTVMIIDSIQRAGKYPGIQYLIVKTDNDTTTVFIGPSWFLEQQNIAFKTDDKIEITGYRIHLEGRPVILAKEIKLGDQKYQVRNESGRPLWRSPPATVQ